MPEFSPRDSNVIDRGGGRGVVWTLGLFNDPSGSTMQPQVRTTVGVTSGAS